MDSVLTEFLEGLSQLRNHVNRLKLIERIISTQIIDEPTSGIEERVKELQQNPISPTQLRQFNYSSVIVSLYGYWENFVEELAREYIKTLNILVDKYESLPEAITTNHLRLSMDLIGRLSLSRYAAIASESTIVANLHSCLTNNGAYVLNDRAFSLHEANLRKKILDRLFAESGIRDLSQQIFDHTNLEDFLRNKGLLATDADAPIPPDVQKSQVREAQIKSAFEYLDDLAERRNVVAHNIPEDILANDSLLDYIEYFENLGASIHQIIFRHTLPHYVSSKGTSLGNPTNVYRNSIITINITDLHIRVGDLLIAHNDSTAPYVGGEIKSIRVNNVPHTDYEAQGTIEIGISTGFMCRLNHSFYLIPQAHIVS